MKGPKVPPAEAVAVPQEESAASEAAAVVEQFGETVGRLLAAGPAEPKAGASIAGRANKKVAEELAQKRKERRELAEKRRERKLIRNKDHAVPQYDERERRLVKVATRGVVQLFNAVAKQQHALKKEADAIATERTAARPGGPKVHRDAYLSMMGPPAGSSGGAAGTSAGGKPSQHQQATPQQPGWSILQDDYLMQAKMKDWEKDESESSGSEDGQSD